MTPHQKGLWQVTIGSVCFGLIGLFGKEAFQAGLSVGQLLSTRFFLASLFLGGFLLIFRRQSLWLPRTPFLTCVGLGFFGYAVFSSFYFLAVEGVSVALAALLLYTYPFWTVIMNALLGEKLRALQWVGIFAASMGLLLLLWGQMEIHSPWALGAGVASAISYALYVVVSGRTLKNVSSFTSGFWIITSAMIGLFVFHRPDLSGVTKWSPHLWWTILGLVLIGTVIPLVLIQAGLRRLTSTETAVLSMIEPVTAAIASFVWFHEFLSPRQWLGAFLVLGSLWLTQEPRRDHPWTKAPPAGSTEA